MTEGLTSCLHGGLHVLFAGSLVNADHFRRLGGIEGANLFRGLGALAADDQVVLATKLATHFFECGVHLAHVLFFAEIDERLILKRALVKADLQTGRGFHGCHRFPFCTKNDRRNFTPVAAAEDECTAFFGRSSKAANAHRMACQTV